MPLSVEHVNDHPHPLTPHHVLLQKEGNKRVGVPGMGVKVSRNKNVKGGRNGNKEVEKEIEKRNSEKGEVRKSENPYRHPVLK